MTRILSLETSTDVCSAALLEDDVLAAEITLNRPRVHAEQLTPMIEQLTTAVGVSYEQLDAVAVSAGPGSYTGLRIGASTAKGLAFAHDLKMIAVPSLEAVAAEATVCASPNDRIAAFRHARRDEYFFALFQVSDESRDSAFLTTIHPPEVVTLDQLNDRLDIPEATRLWVVGDKQETIAEAMARETDLFTSGRPSPTAYWDGRCAVHRYHNEDFVDLASFEPEYLRPFHTHKPTPIFDRLPDGS